MHQASPSRQLPTAAEPTPTPTPKAAPKAAEPTPTPTATPKEEADPLFAIPPADVILDMAKTDDGIFLLNIYIYTHEAFWENNAHRDTRGHKYIYIYIYI